MITINEEKLSNIRICIVVKDIFGTGHTICFPLCEVVTLSGLRAFTFIWNDEEDFQPTRDLESFDDLLQFLKDD